MKKGAIFSEEHKRHLSESHKKSLACIEWRKKLHESSKGKHYSSATEFKKGQHYSLSTEFKKGIQNNPNSPCKKGNCREKSISWKGGRRFHSLGYIEIYHNNPNRKDKYILEHRYVMEQHIGRPLNANETVHHIDENRSNNSIDNLMLFPNKSAHLAYHRSIK
jgi:hypothetical protein